ncbi:hypothetical protein ALC56_08509, partial [Trachymyrmex septentrionalis]
TKGVSGNILSQALENLPVKQCTQFKVATSVRPEGIKGQTWRQVYRQEVGFSAAFFELRNDVIDGAREQEGWLLRVRLDPACGRASALHLHPVKCRKVVKARAVMCRIASCIRRSVSVLQTSKDTGSISAKSAPLTSRELYESGKGFRTSRNYLRAEALHVLSDFDICLWDSSRLKMGDTIVDNNVKRMILRAFIHIRQQGQDSFIKQSNLDRYICFAYIFQRYLFRMA